MCIMIWEIILMCYRWKRIGNNIESVNINFGCYETPWKKWGQKLGKYQRQLMMIKTSYDITDGIFNFLGGMTNNYLNSS